MMIMIKILFRDMMMMMMMTIESMMMMVVKINNKVLSNVINIIFLNNRNLPQEVENYLPMD